MGGIRISGNTSGNIAEVNTVNELKVNTPLTSILSGYSAMTAISDPGEVTGIRYNIDPECSTDYKQRVGLDTLIANEFFPGTVLNSNVWTSVVTTMTTTLASGFLNLNPGLSTASGAVARVSSYRGFPVFGTVETYFEASMQFVQPPVTNNVTEWGLCLATGVAAPTDGAVFRFNAAGEFRCVVINNSVELQSNSLDFNALIGVNTTTNFIVSLGTSTVHFWINDILVASMKLPVAGSISISSCNLPVMFRTYNTAITGAAQVTKIANSAVTLGDGNYSKPYAHQMSGGGNASYQTQTGAATHGQTAVWTNSANPTAAAPTNTTAALGSGLGGIFIANINALAVTTDFIISSFQVPVATAAIPGRSLYVTGVKISSVNTVVANGAGPTTWAMAIAYGHTSVSLATAEAATTKAPRRIPVGVQSLANAAVIGQPASPDISYSFSTPICVQPGEFIQTILRFISNNSAATEALNFYITFEGYFE